MFIKRSTFGILSLFIALVLTFSTLGVTPADAIAGIVVNSSADAIADDGLCTLREAITNANGDSQLYATAGECPAGSGADTITFAADYTITLVGSQLPAVTTAISINGNGEANTILQANAAPKTATYRVVEVVTAGNLTLNSLTVRNGRCNGSCATNSMSGGGIYNAGTLTVSNVTFSANSASSSGGGMYNNSSSPTLTNVVFSTNSATLDGGGMYNNSSSPMLMNVTFSANSAFFGGGGMYNNTSSPTLTNVTFSANSATPSAGGGWGMGGGMYNDWSSPTLTNVSFSANSAGGMGGMGGGMYNNSSSPTLTNVTFSANSATYPAADWGGGSGGGMFNNNSSPTLTNVTFSANSATNSAGWGGGGGGGMSNNGSSPTLTNVTFSANSAGQDGGGMLNHSSSPTLTNVTFSANSANFGGGMYNNNSSPTLTNVTFSTNYAHYGGGMYNINNSSPALTNVIIANSVSGGDCYNYSVTLNAASYNNLIEDAANACGLINAVNRNIIGSDPMLGVLANNGGFTQTFALLAGSPAINSGTNTGCPATDQRGAPRPQGAQCDIGAYEVQAQAGPAFVVNSNADAIADDGLCTLREAITNANGDSQLYATAGECSAGSGADTISFAANYTITLVGSQLPAVTTAITINGNGEANTIIEANAAPNTATYRVVEVVTAGNLTLNSLTVRNGRCNGSCATDTNAGGGVYNAGTLTVSNVTFSANSADWGGGMINISSSPTLTNVTFSANSASGGGGMTNINSSPTLMNVTFSANSASNYGGGMYNQLGSPALTNVTFSANSATTYGGGGMINDHSSPMLTNVTFSANSATSGGGMFNFMYSSPTLTNTIIANSVSGGDCVNDTSSTLNAQNSLIEDGLACINGTNTNNLTGDPMLGALANNGGFTQTFALLAGSPAINSGTNTGCPATDQRGATRPQGAQCDIGAYEVDIPIIASVKRLDSNPTLGSSVNFSVTFSENVTGVDIGDFSLMTSGVSGAAVSGVSGSGSVYTVTVNTGSGNGTIRLDVVDDDTILDASSNPLNGGYTGGETYDITKDFTLTITSAHGTVVKNPDQATYHEGDVVQLIATPDVGWSFANWTGDLSSSLNPDSVTIHGNTSVTANYTLDNQAPTDIAISNNSVSENQAAGTTVGTFSSTDPDAGDTFTYSLVSGAGSADNAAFTISGSALKIAYPFNFASKNSYSIRMRTTDQGGLNFEKAFTINVTDLPAIFADVTDTYWSNSYIERLYNAGITSGCTTVPLNYCPTTPVTRAQMAIFLLRGMHGSSYVPPLITATRFNDVPVDSFGAAFIEQLAVEGITSGCGSGNYCPNTPVSRAQMAIFLVRAKHGIAFTPPTATGIFTDVPVGSFGADFIEQLSADAITSGCGSGNFCPNTTVKRDSMAVFLVKTFNLP